MKMFVVSAFSLLVGLAVGWRASHWHNQANREAAEAVDQLVQGTESWDAAEAARDVQAISFISCGDTGHAVRLLSAPIAHYHSTYTPVGSSNDRRARLIGLIDQLARTNKVVADRIAEVSNY